MNATVEDGFGRNPWFAGGCSDTLMTERFSVHLAVSQFHHRHNDAADVICPITNTDDQTAGQACFHQRHHALSRATEQAGSTHRSFAAHPQARRRHR